MRSIVIAHGFANANKRTAVEAIKLIKKPTCDDVTLTNLIYEIASEGGSRMKVNHGMSLEERLHEWIRRTISAPRQSVYYEYSDGTTEEELKRALEKALTALLGENTTDPQIQKMVKASPSTKVRSEASAMRLMKR